MNELFSANYITIFVHLTSMITCHENEMIVRCEASLHIVSTSVFTIDYFLSNFTHLMEILHQFNSLRSSLIQII